MECNDFYRYFADDAPAPQAIIKQTALSSLINPLITTLTKNTASLYTYTEVKDITYRTRLFNQVGPLISVDYVPDESLDQEDDQNMEE